MPRKVLVGLIEADHDECAIVVHYRVEVATLDSQRAVAEVETSQKRIKLKTLSEHSNLQSLDKCKLIHRSKLPTVERLLLELQQGRAYQQRRREAARASIGRLSVWRASFSTPHEADAACRSSEVGSEPHTEQPTEQPAEQPAELGASIDELEPYVELMYEGVEAAKRATRLVLELSRHPPNLEPLLAHDALVNIISRLLREAAGKAGGNSSALCLNLLHVLYAFSAFSHFHQRLLGANVGNSVLRLVMIQTKRHVAAESFKRHRVGGNEEHGGAVAHGMAPAELRHRLRRREEPLFLALHIILNLSEDPSTERRMSRKGLVVTLCELISSAGRAVDTSHIDAFRTDASHTDASEPPSGELILIALTLLKKLVLYTENLPAVREAALVAALAPFAAHSHKTISVAALRLLYNLSFDAICREQLLENAHALSQLCALLRCGGGEKQRRLVGAQLQIRQELWLQTGHQPVQQFGLQLAGDAQLPHALRMLHNLCVDTHGRSALARTGMPVLLRKLLVECTKGQLPLELASLAINLATQARAAEVLCEGGAVRQMLKRLYCTHDTLLIKLLRNLCAHEGSAQQAAPFAADLFALVQQVEGEELLVELLGLLASLLRLPAPSELACTARQHGIVAFVVRAFTSRSVAADVLLELIIVIGELVASAEVAELLLKWGVIFDAAAEAQGNCTLCSLIVEK